MWFVEYLKYSGLSVTITFNPWHWAYMPVWKKDGERDVWELNTHRFSFLFLTVRIWIDNGEW